jgi:hypothetical protein
VFCRESQCVEIGGCQCRDSQLAIQLALSRRRKTSELFPQLLQGLVIGSGA